MLLLKNQIISILAISLLVLTSFSTNNQNSKAPAGCVFIPSGTYLSTKGEIHCDAFWIYDHEITNHEYSEFLTALKKAGRMEDLEIARIHTENWLNKNSFNEPYAKYYHEHPAYAEYPVVNITHEAAEMFCEWLNEKSNNDEVKYRLPSYEELVYAAKGGYDLSDYPWGGSSLRDKKGNALCNYRTIGDEHIHSDSTGKMMIAGAELNNVSTITAPAKSYNPNEYGLYNTSGNVAEMLKTNGLALGGSWVSTGYDVRVESIMNYTGSSIYVGFRPVKDFLGK